MRIMKEYETTLVKYRLLRANKVSSTKCYLSKICAKTMCTKNAIENKTKIILENFILPKANNGEFFTYVTFGLMFSSLSSC